jgi:hypothetical protein
MTAAMATISTIADDPTPSPATGMSTVAVRSWLRLEGLAGLVAGLVLFGISGGSWLLLIPLLLLPDVSALGYLAGPRVGAFTYNLIHTWAPGFVTLAIGAWLASPVLLVIGAILVAHVGMDRAMGYGLKLPSSFQDTHLGRIGRSKA